MDIFLKLPNGELVEASIDEKTTASGLMENQLSAFSNISLAYNGVPLQADEEVHRCGIRLGEELAVQLSEKTVSEQAIKNSPFAKMTLSSYVSEFVHNQNNQEYPEEYLDHFLRTGDANTIVNVHLYDWLSSDRYEAILDAIEALQNRGLGRFLIQTLNAPLTIPVTPRLLRVVLSIQRTAHKPYTRTWIDLLDWCIRNEAEGFVQDLLVNDVRFSEQHFLSKVGEVTPAMFKVFLQHMTCASRPLLNRIIKTDSLLRYKDVLLQAHEDTDHRTVLNRILNTMALPLVCERGVLEEVEMITSWCTSLEKNNPTAIRAAARAGFHQAIKHLVRCGLRLNTTSVNKPIYDACAAGCLCTVKYLIQQGATVDQKCLQNAVIADSTPIVELLLSMKVPVISLHVAARHRPHMLELLIKSCPVAVLNSIRNGCTPLTLAAQHVQEEYVLLLLSRGADPKVLAPFPAQECARRGFAVALSKMLETESVDSTALEAAVEGNHIKVASILLRGGAQVGNSARLATSAGMVLLLKEHGQVISGDILNTIVATGSFRDVCDLMKVTKNAAMHDAGGVTPLHIAAGLRNPHFIVQELLERGGCPNAASLQGIHDTPLYRAVRKRYGGVVAMLLAKGATVQETDLIRAIAVRDTGVLEQLAQRCGEGLKGSRNVAREAVKAGSAEAVSCLAANKFDLGHSNKAEGGLVSLALIKGNREVALALLAAQAGMDNDHTSSVLHRAMRLGDIRVVTKVLATGADIAFHNSAGYTPLHTAAMHKGKTFLTEVLDVNGGVFQKHINAKASSNGRTPLGTAVRNGNTEAAKLLLQHGADPKGQGLVNTALRKLRCEKDHISIHIMVRQLGEFACEADTHGNTPLSTCIKRNWIHTMQVLLELDPKPDVNQEHEGETMLQLACGSHATVLQMLLEAGADPNKRGKGGDTPIHTACRLGAEQHLTYLMNRGADITALSGDGETAFWVGDALTYRMMQKLITNGVSRSPSKTNSGGMTPLMSLYATRRHDSCDVLVYKEYLNTQDDEGDTAVHYAAHRRRIVSVDSLYNSGFDFALKNNNGQNVFHVFAMNGVYLYPSSFAGVPLESLSFLEELDCFDRTPLMWAAETHASALLRCSADTRNSTGMTAMHFAARNATHKMVSLITTYGCDPCLQDAQGDTPLHYALLACQRFSSYRSRFTRTLIEKMRSCNQQNKQGKTPLHVAAELGLDTCIVCLLSNGADCDIQDNEGHTALDVAREKVKHMLVSHTSRPAAKRVRV